MKKLLISIFVFMGVFVSLSIVSAEPSLAQGRPDTKPETPFVDPGPEEDPTIDDPTDDTDPTTDPTDDTEVVPGDDDSGSGGPSAKEDVCAGVALTGGTCEDPETGATVDSTIATVVNILSIAIGVVAVIMIMIGGFKYITSTGESGNINGAKNTILYAIIGLVIVALAQVIVQFVIVRTTPDKEIDSSIIKEE